jgi:hypothetical protein
MKTAGNILVFTQGVLRMRWCKHIHCPILILSGIIISPGIKIILVTAEQPHIALSKDETDQVNKGWRKQKYAIVTPALQTFGLKKINCLCRRSLKTY